MTLKRNNVEMERNPATAAAANTFGYYKDPLSYVSSTPAYSDVYQTTFPFEDDIKDKRYQYPPAANGATSYQQVQPSQQQQQPQHAQHAQQSQAISNLQYHQSYATKSEYHQQAYKAVEKTQPIINPYANYTYPNYKDGSQYTSTAGYYDQYKFNVGIGTTAVANYGKPTKDTNYHQNFSPGMYPDSKLGTVAYCEEPNHSTKASMIKSTSASQVAQYPMYSNCYGYPTAAAFPNQNYCSYAQSCNDDARALWDEYQTNRRLISSYLPTAAVAPPVSVQNPSVPPQPNCRIKANYSAEYYGSNAAYHAYHSAEGMRTREKLIYPVNSHAPSDNLYNTRSRCLPVDYKYQQAMPQNVMMTAYDPRYNYVAKDAQTFDYCSPRQDAGTAYHYPTYGKANLATPPSQKHIRTPAALPNEYCNSQAYYLCNDQLGVGDFQDVYSQQSLRPDARHTMGYNVSMMPGNRSTSVNDMIGKEALYAQPLQGAYYSHSAAMNLNSQPTLQHSHGSSEKSKASVTKGQNLREFLASWNEDEDDGVEKIDENGDQLYLQQTNFEVENTTTENHLQFKGSFNTRPKIHVGITVDSNVANNQYINLPDIIIDIEKPKDADLISHSIETTQNGSTEKLVVLESVDIPVSDLTQYTNINLLESSIDALDTALQTPGFVLTEDAHSKLTTPINEVVDEIMKQTSEDPIEELSQPSLDDLLNVEGKVEKIVTVKDHSESLRCISKERRRKRASKTKIVERNKSKCRMLARIIKTRSGKLIRIRKVKKNTKKRRNLLTKKNNNVTSEHSKDEPKRIHSSYNPKTLKDICICYFNSPTGRDLLLSGRDSKSDQKNEKDSEESDELMNNQSKPSLSSLSSSSSIPKLSALCEYALSGFYEAKNTLLLNVDDLDSNLYFIECDINENVVSAEENHLNQSDFIELYVDDEMDGNTTINDITINCGNGSAIETISTLTSSSNTTEAEAEAVVEATTPADANYSFNSCRNVISTNDHDSNILDDSLNEICLTTDENSRDFSALHHEEIVPDNLHAFENEKLLKYLQHKYIQKSNYLKIFVIDKICKKYRKYVLKRRNNQKYFNETTKKLLVSTLKDTFVKQTKHFSMDDSSC